MHTEEPPRQALSLAQFLVVGTPIGKLPRRGLWVAAQFPRAVNL
jgi:hypothetical protein